MKLRLTTKWIMLYYINKCFGKLLNCIREFPLQRCIQWKPEDDESQRINMLQSLKIGLNLHQNSPKMRLLIVILASLLLSGNTVLAQDKSATDSKTKSEAAKVDYSKEPVWIKMKEDPNVNYYEAIKAFEAYWNGKIEPEEEHELITEGKITEEKAKQMKAERASWTQAQRNEYERIKYEFKRFKQWKRDVKPYVQSDGRILNEQEKMEIYNKQQQNR